MNEVAEKAGRKCREEWVGLMATYEAGDLLQREFCERHGVAYSTFRYWRKRLRSPVVPRTRASEPLFELSSFGLGEDSPEWRVELDLGSGVML